MQIAVLIEPLKDGRFRASPNLPLKAIGEGNSEDEALANLRFEIEMELRAGKQVVMIDVDVPLLKLEGNTLVEWTQ